MNVDPAGLKVKQALGMTTAQDLMRTGPEGLDEVEEVVKTIETVDNEMQNSKESVRHSAHTFTM